MALDVWVGYPERGAGGPVVSFEPEAYYAFLSPLFEDFGELHGKWIDPYGGAVFEGTELAQVLALVGRARALVEQQPHAFDVHMGTKIGSFLEPCNEEIYSHVKRDEYLAFIDRLRGAVVQAQQGGKPLVFSGD